MFLLLGGQPGRHALDLGAELLDLGVLFPQKTLLLFDLLGVHDHLFLWDQSFVKAALFVITAVAIIHPLNKFKQTLQRGQRIPGGNAALRMYRKISQLDHIGKLSPCVGIQRKAEARLMDQRLEVVLVGHLHGVVCRIDPLHRQLQRLPAAHGTHSRAGMVHLLRLHRSGRE